MKNNEKDELMETTFLKVSVEEYLKDPVDEKAIDVVTHLVFLVGTGRKALMPLLNLTRLTLDFNPDAEAGELFGEGPEPDELFTFIEGEDGRLWFPLFTDKDEIGEAVKTNAVRAVPIKSILEAALDAESIEGIIINPESDGFALSKVTFGFILEKAKELEGMDGSGVTFRPVRKKNNRKNNKK